MADCEITRYLLLIFIRRQFYLYSLITRKILLSTLSSFHRCRKKKKQQIECVGEIKRFVWRTSWYNAVKKGSNYLYIYDLIKQYFFLVFFYDTASYFKRIRVADKGTRA